MVSPEMQKHRIRGLSLAIIEKGKIAVAKGYGFTDRGGKVPVTTSTLSGVSPRVSPRIVTFGGV